MHFTIPLLLASITTLTNAGEMPTPNFNAAAVSSGAHPPPPASGAPSWGTVTSFVNGSSCPANTGGRTLDAKPGFCTKNTDYAAGDLLSVDFGTGAAAFTVLNFYTDHGCQTPGTVGPVDKASLGAGCVRFGDNMNSFLPTA